MARLAVSNKKITVKPKELLPCIKNNAFAVFAAISSSYDFFQMDVNDANKFHPALNMFNSVQQAG